MTGMEGSYLSALVRAACQRVAPMWPLDRFVAVNPFLGFTSMPFPEAAARLGRVAGVRMTLPGAFYQAEIAAGRIPESDLVAVGPAATPEPCAPVRIVTFGEALDTAIGTSWAPLADAEAARFTASWADAGQAGWPLIGREAGLFATWYRMARIDRTAEATGLAGFRAALHDLPSDPWAAIAWAVDVMRVQQAVLEDVLDGTLWRVRGWAAVLRQRDWDARLAGDRDDAIIGLLAIRLAWDAALCQLHPSMLPAWHAGLSASVTQSAVPLAELALQDAYEAGWQRRLLGKLAGAATPAPEPSVQAVFCIDVRSEVFRRALEAAVPEVQTIGFAGFFGFPIEVFPNGAEQGRTCCPVLMAPSMRVCERVDAPSRAQDALLRTGARAWAGLRRATAGGFSFVEAAGLGYAARLAADAIGVGRAAPPPVRPEIAPGVRDGQATGLSRAQALDAAEAALRGMSLTKGFARLVLLTGHGAQVTNTPHAAAFDCGACGGQAGDANARVAAAVLNDPGVRSGLASRGIAIPAETRFLAGLHNTTTDEVELFDTADLPASHAPDIARLRAWLTEAGDGCRAARLESLGLAGVSDPLASLRRRSRDWAELRPEWGLAGNAAFIAAPRARTRGCDLEGRAFLHEYDETADPTGAVLEMIMTAPMVVASWINLQYYAATVDNAAFGSGDKMLHDVVGRIGVVLGNGGDLRTGLPLQSLGYGGQLRHQPLRLCVLIAAAPAAIDAVLARHADVAALVDNAWMHLLSWADDGSCQRRVDGRWTAV